MFHNLKDTILKLNADVSDLANQEKAKALRKKLLTAGGICGGVGGVGVIACFVAFGVLSFTYVQSFSTSFGYALIPFFLMIPFAVALVIGMILLRFGLSILIAGVTTKFVDKSLNRRCECGNTLEVNEKFCPKCGRPAVKVCPKCNTQNDLKDEFCSNCGNKL